ncbi:unnamed protein product, partial [Hymenolepis diminuta]
MTIYRLEMKRLDWESLKGWEYLSEINRQQRMTCCVSLCSRERNFRHLFQTATKSQLTLTRGGGSFTTML